MLLTKVGLSFHNLNRKMLHCLSVYNIYTQGGKKNEEDEKNIIRCCSVPTFFSLDEKKHSSDNLFFWKKKNRNSDDDPEAVWPRFLLILPCLLFFSIFTFPCHRTDLKIHHSSSFIAPPSKTFIIWGFRYEPLKKITKQTFISLDTVQSLSCQTLTLHNLKSPPLIFSSFRHILRASNSEKQIHFFFYKETEASFPKPQIV